MARTGPESIGNILAQLMAQKGFGRERGVEAFEDAWRAAAGELAGRYSRVGGLRRGKLEITVANSMLVQELTFQKPNLLKTLREQLPEETIRDLRFRVGAIS
jgi:predicted nucleic acid-binding Zn ribbon protein